MPRKSEISKLPKDIRELITKLREQGCTLDDIIEKLGELDIDVSRSSLGRFTKKQAKIFKEIEKSRMLAESVTKQFGDKPSSDIAKVNIEILHSIILKLLIADPDGDGEINMSAKEAATLSGAIEKLSKAHKTDIDGTIRIREEAKKEALEDAAKSAEVIGKKQGLTKDTVNLIKQQILGV